MANGTAHIQAPTITPQTPIIDVDMQALLPLDTIPEDTATYTETVTDTLVYMDGMDTVYELTDSSYITYDTMAERKAPTTLLSSNTIRNNNAETTYKKIGSGTNSISISASAAKTLTGGIYGINVSGMFDNASLPNDGTSNYGWQMLIDLAPDVLRFPSGSFGKFIHLLPYRDIDGLPGLDPIKGYGYDLAEIIRYFDITDGTLQNPTLTSVLYGADSTLSWMSGEFRGEFGTYKDKWKQQELLPAGTKYIDAFIKLIQQVETDHSGHKVNIILCLNIISESATQCKAIVTYLRSNAIHNCTVEGVELGNECYGKFHEKIMGFEEFSNYYSFLKGDSIAGFNSFLSNKSDHNFFSVLKGSPTFTCKIGLCAESIHTESLPFRTPPPTIRATDSWNTDLAAHYADKITGGAYHPYLFDAVILHPYYDNAEWDTCALYHLDSTYLCHLADMDTTNDNWTFGLYDERLRAAWNAIQANFKSLITTRYKESYDEANTQLNLNLTSAKRKELWTTEWNMKIDFEDYISTADKRIADVYTNGYMHGWLLQEWWLKNIKLNFSRPYKENFFTIATLQNFAGGTDIDLLSPADDIELDTLGKSTYPALAGRKYYMKRTTELVMEGISTITKNNLNYLNCNYSMFNTNPNVSPTTFIDATRQYAYIYYTNIKATTQKYIIDTIGVAGLSPSNEVSLGTATIYCVDAKKNYSTSGQNTLYDINACYNETTDPHPIELRTTVSYINTAVCTGTMPANHCIEVSAYSIGYIKIPIYISPPKLTISTLKANDIALYPNPSANYFTIAITNEAEHNTLLTLDILSIDGTLCKQLTCMQQASVDVQGLASGYYFVAIHTQNNQPIYKSFVKIR